MIDFKGSQFERDIILWGVRWYVAYPISYRQLEEMMAERGVEVDHPLGDGRDDDRAGRGRGRSSHRRRRGPTPGDSSACDAASAP